MSATTAVNEPSGKTPSAGASAGRSASVDGGGSAGGETPRALEIVDLHKRFGDTVVLDGIDVSMAPGEFLVLVGPSGCGKSTLLNCLAGLEEISGGRLAIAGRDVTRVPPRERDIAMVFQSYALYPTMSIADNIGFGMKVRRVPRAERERKIAEVAELLQIGHLLGRKPAQLSGGQRQRVAMGRALVRDPTLFLFDEPLSNLDAKLRVEMRAEIKRVHQSTGASIVYVTHDQIEAMTLATRIVVLKGGVVQQIATPEEIYAAPANTFVADFMGSPPMNLVPARVAADGEALLFGDERRLSLSLPAGVRERERVTLGIRPEAFSRRAGEGPALAIEPTMIENSGADAYLNFAIGERSLTARLAGRFAGSLGETVSLSLDTAGLCYFDSEDGTLLRR